MVQIAPLVECGIGCDMSTDLLDSFRAGVRFELEHDDMDERHFAIVAEYFLGEDLDGRDSWKPG